MQKEQFAQTIREAFQRSRKLNITFKPNTAGHIYCLLKMDADSRFWEDSSAMKYRNSHMWLKKGDVSMLQDIMNSYDWSKNPSRTVTIFFGVYFDEKLFLDQMYDALEKIEVVK